MKTETNSMRIVKPGKNIYVASGTVQTTGGYFSDKSAPLESGYKFQDVNITANGNQYNYQVVSGQ